MIITPEGQIAATLIPLACALFALFRWLVGKFDRIDDKFDSTRNETKDDIQNLDAKFSTDIRDVRQASENSHKEIIGRQGAMQTTLAAHTERFNTVQAQIKCVEDKVDNLSKSN